MDKLLKEFKNPPAAYRGKPFWCWNGQLEGEELEWLKEATREI